MIKTIIISTCLTCLVPMVSAQEYGNKQICIDSTSRFVRTAGPNRFDSSGHAVGKLGIDRKLFGDFNARVEYLLEPSFSETIGCRIYRRATDTAYVLEVKRVDNYKEVEDQVQKEFPTISIPGKEFFAMSEEEHARVLAHNRQKWGRMAVERLKRYRIRTISVPISDRLADRLYEATKGEILNIEPEKKRYTKEGGEIITLIFDGEPATFRCVVEDDTVWTLRYHVPEGAFKILSDLFRAMIADIEAGRFDETRYQATLDDME